MQRQSPLPPPPHGMSMNPVGVDKSSTEFVILFTEEVEEIELPDKF